MEITFELMEKIKNVETPEEIVQIAKESFTFISLEEAEKIFKMLKG